MKMHDNSECVTDNGKGCNISSEGFFTSAASTSNETTTLRTPPNSLLSTESLNPPEKLSTLPLQPSPIASIVSSTSQLSLEPSDLLQWKDMPEHLQFNPYVLTGYRPLQSFKECMFSLFYWHNESINIITHGIPIVYILATVPSLMPWEKEFRFLSFCHIFGSVAPWCGSFIYHLFMNLERGEKLYYRLLKLDMLGIWVSQSFGALPMVTASMFCFSLKWKWSIIFAYSILCIWGLYKAMTALSPWQRRLCFLLPFMMRLILAFFRSFQWVGGNPTALTHVFLQDAVSVLGGAIGAMHIPEKWFPGSVDLYLNSHNIMHVLVVLAVYSMHQATISDFEWMSKDECHSTITTIENLIENTNSGEL